MAKTLDTGQIEIEKGDTLYDIYGADWKTKSDYTGDPTKLQIGTILPGLQSSTIPTDTLSGSSSLVKLGEPEIAKPPLIVNDTQFSPVEDPMKWAKDYMGTLKETYPVPPSGAEAYTKAYGPTDTPEQIAQKEQAVKASTDKINALNAQIQGIMNTATQAQLTLESQAAGKDITSTFLGRQQQEISRQSAIQVLPLQTQVLTEQATLTGNTALLEQAQGKIDTYFKYQQQNAENQYDYQQKIIDKFFDFATEQEKTKLANLKDERNKEFQLASANRSDQNTWAISATENGQGVLAGQIMALDATSDTFQQDLARLAEQIKEKAKAASIPTIKSGGLVIAESNVATAQQQLDTSRGQSYQNEKGETITPTGVDAQYVNSALYLQMLDAWKKDGGLEQDFFTQFPPKNYLNPNDASVPTYIREKLSKPTEEETDTEALTKAIKELNKPWWQFW